MISLEKSSLEVLQTIVKSCQKWQPPKPELRHIPPASDEVFLSCAAMFLPCLGTLGTLMGAYELDISRGIERGECIHLEAYVII